ncbi:MAG: hypothetical protein M3004_11385 [Bacteroidota bacterium]|nr:hypothetical protein [Bacteroidota bacterium]
MKQITSSILFLLFISLHVCSQVKVKSATVNNISTQSTIKSPNSQNGLLLNTNTLTPARPKIEGLAEFTTIGESYSRNKKFMVYGCTNISGITSPFASGGCKNGVYIKFLDTTHTKFKVDVIVNYDKTYYKEDIIFSKDEFYNKIQESNDYTYYADGSVIMHTPMGDMKEKLASNNQSGKGIQKFSLIIDRRADGTALTTEDIQRVIINLSANYAFELRSVTVTPLQKMSAINSNLIK